MGANIVLRLSRAQRSNDILAWEETDSTESRRETVLDVNVKESSNAGVIA